MFDQNTEINDTTLYMQLELLEPKPKGPKSSCDCGKHNESHDGIDPRELRALEDDDGGSSQTDGDDTLQDEDFSLVRV